MVYQIKVKGELDKSWLDWLGCNQITSEKLDDGSTITILIIDAADQSTLFGILDRIRDLNISLISVAERSQKNKAEDKF